MKKLSQEDDLTLLKEYGRKPFLMSIHEMIFVGFLMVLFKVNIILFWILVGLSVAWTIAFMFDKVPSRFTLIKNELIKRGVEI